MKVDKASRTALTICLSQFVLQSHEPFKSLVTIEQIKVATEVIKHFHPFLYPILNFLRSFAFFIRFLGRLQSKRAVAGRTPRRYANLEDAYKRMKEENNHLSDEQARHLTIHGISQNEDGSYSWKFDPYMRVFPPYDLAQSDAEALWAAITCPTLLMYGEDSWASNPEKDGRAKHFNTARVVSFRGAGHWVHHDQFKAFMAELRAFL